MIHEAVSSAREFMPDEMVLVIDSASSERYPASDLRGAFHCRAGNKHYATGAFWDAYTEHIVVPDSDFFYLLHDSCLITDDLTDLRARDVTAVRWWPAAAEGGWGVDSAGVGLHHWGQVQWAEHIGLPFPKRFQGCFGPMLACQRHVLDEVHDLGLHRIKATDKWEACAMERLWGAALNLLGYDLADGALQGEMGSFHGEYDTSRIDKRHGERM